MYSVVQYSRDWHCAGSVSSLAGGGGEAQLYTLAYIYTHIHTQYSRHNTGPGPSTRGHLSPAKKPGWGACAWSVVCVCVLGPDVVTMHLCSMLIFSALWPDELDGCSLDMLQECLINFSPKSLTLLHLVSTKQIVIVLKLLHITLAVCFRFIKYSNGENIVVVRPRPDTKWLVLSCSKQYRGEMFKTKNSNTKKSEDVKKSAGKVLDTKKDTPTRAKVNQSFSIWLENVTN